MKVEILDSDWWDLRGTPFSYFHLKLRIEDEACYLNLKIDSEGRFEVSISEVFGERWDKSTIVDISSKYHTLITKLLDEIDDQLGINLDTPQNLDNPKIIGLKIDDF